jgi:hypothetical protein
MKPARLAKEWHSLTLWSTSITMKSGRYMDLVVKNFGQTAAYNIRLTLPPLQVAPFKSQITGELVEPLSIPESIAVLAPGQEWRTLWDSAVRREKYKGELQTQFVGRVEFDDKLIPDKPSVCNPISLDINTFWNTTWIERTTNKTVEDALYDIAGTLKGYKQEHDGIWVYTVPGDEERQYDDQLRTDAEQRTEDFYEAATRRSDTPAQPQDE